MPREQKMLNGHLPRVIYHQVYYRGTSLIRNTHPLRITRSLGIGPLKGPTGQLFLMSEVPL